MRDFKIIFRLLKQNQPLFSPTLNLKYALYLAILMKSLNKLTRYTIAIIILIVIIAIALSTFLRYTVSPQEVYLIEQENLIEDGGFENFNDTAGDCCNSFSGNASIFSSQSQDSYSENYSLNLTSFNHCACITKDTLDFLNTNNYIISFYYKGDNPRFCNWVKGDNTCMPNQKLDPSETWTLYRNLFSYTNLSEASSIFLYADSSGQPTTNLYDSLEIHRLILTDYEELQDLNDFKEQAREEGAIELVSSINADTSNEQYIILTKKDNIVHNGEFLSDSSKEDESGFAYYLVSGMPDITLKFPWTEIIIVLIMGFIVIRLLFKKNVIHAEHEIKEEIDRIIQGV